MLSPEKLLAYLSVEFELKGLVVEMIRKTSRTKAAKQLGIGQAALKRIVDGTLPNPKYLEEFYARAPVVLPLSERARAKLKKDENDWVAKKAAGFALASASSSGISLTAGQLETHANGIGQYRAAAEDYAARWREANPEIQI